MSDQPGHAHQGMTTRSGQILAGVESPDSSSSSSQRSTAGSTESGDAVLHWVESGVPGVKSRVKLLVIETNVLFD